MNAHSKSSGPRGGLYSESKFTNWADHDPFFMEAQTAHKLFFRRRRKSRNFPHIVTMPALKPDFMQVCTPGQVERRLVRMPSRHLDGLEAVFLLGGTRKQQLSWNSAAYCSGIYWRRCVFLCAYLFDDARKMYIEDLRSFFLDDVLVHEVAHHVDRFRSGNRDEKEGFAVAFVQQKRA